MPEARKSEVKAEAKPAVDKDLLPAAESSDPAVQVLLAEKDAAAQNGDDEAAKNASERLAALGYK